MTRRRPHRLARAARAAIAASLFAASLFAAACARPAPAPADTLSAPPAAGVAAAASGISLDDLDVEWIDATGTPLRLADLRGPVRVIALVYTSCQATCPLIVADLKRVEASVPADRRDDVRFVLVSLDPDRDTPGRLAAWAAETRLDPARWTLLAGDDDAVRELAATVGIRYQRQQDGEMAHTNAITVLDTLGAIAHQQRALGDTGETVVAVARLLR